MSLPSWAERLRTAPYSPETIDLHVKDTLAAFLTGLRTSEGQTLAQFYAGRAEPAECAAAAAGIARLSECDDIHPASCVTPGAVVIPVALALTGNRGADDVGKAVAAGYAAGLRLGIGIGGTEALAAGVWPTLLAAPLMAAVTASCLRGHDPGQLAQAMALALAGASGRLGRPMAARTGRWFSLAEAVAKGIRASDAAGRGFHGDLGLISKPWLMAEAGHDSVDMDLFELAEPEPSIDDVDFKPFPIARQGANAVEAFRRLLARRLDLNRIDTVHVFVPAMNVALLSRPVVEDDRLSRLCNMGFQLACAALAPELLDDAERAAAVPLMDFASRVSVASASDLDAHLPERWAARVVVHAGSDRFEETVIRAPFDHDADDLVEFLSGKWRRMLTRQDWEEFFSDSSLYTAFKHIQQRIGHTEIQSLILSEKGK